MATKRKPSVKQLEKLISQKTQDKYFNLFAKQARYYGYGVYGIPGTNIKANDTRELFLKFCAVRVGIDWAE